MTSSKNLYMFPKIRTHSLMTLALIAASMISTAGAAVSCYSTSPQCCWVVRSWQLMGKFTDVSSTSSTACCSMQGVTCSGSTITMIDWNTQGLTGYLPADIGNLRSMNRLCLAHNQLTGSIPSTIGNLVNLYRLNIEGNQLTGPIPSTIGNLVKLSTLWLIGNEISGSIPSTIGNLRNLTYLNLINNKLSGSIPSTIGNLANLKWLWISTNQLTGPIPSTIGNLRNLEYLYLAKNLLTGSIPSTIGNLVNLQEVRIHANQLTGSIPSTIGNLRNLRLLYIGENNFSGSIPSILSTLVNLEAFYVNDNPGLTGTFRPQCTTKFYASMSRIIMCGCKSQSSPPTIFPPQGTPAQCLASGPALSLEKRALAFSATIAGYKYTCNTDVNLNPYADCLNSMAKICNSSNTATFSKSVCQNGVDQMFGGMSTLWKNVRKECGQWSWNGVIGSKDNPNCDTANTALQKNAYYLVWNADIKGYARVNVFFGLTDSINVRLWGNPALKG